MPMRLSPSKVEDHECEPITVSLKPIVTRRLAGDFPKITEKQIYALKKAGLSQSAPLQISYS